MYPLVGGEKKLMTQRRKKLIKILTLLTQLFCFGGGLHFVSVLNLGWFSKNISLINVKLSTRFLQIESTSQISEKNKK